jgi:uncharacterized RDD family membrane protein YckC
MSDDWEFKLDKDKIKEPEEPQVDIEIPRKRSKKKLDLDFDNVKKRGSRRTDAYREIKLPPAKIIHRILASIIDYLFILISSYILYITDALAQLNITANLNLYYTTIVMISAFTFICIPTKMLMSSLGGKIFKIGIEDIDGGPLSFTRITLRELLLKPLCIATVLPLVPIFFAKKQALYDLILKIGVYDNSNPPSVSE